MVKDNFYLPQDLHDLVQALRDRVSSDKEGERKLSLSEAVKAAVLLYTPGAAEEFPVRHREGDPLPLQPSVSQRVRAIVRLIRKTRKQNSMEFSKISSVYEEALCRYLSANAAAYGLTADQQALLGYSKPFRGTIPQDEIKELHAALNQPQILRKRIASVRGIDLDNAPLADEVEQALSAAVDEVRATAKRTTPTLILMTAENFLGAKDSTRPPVERGIMVCERWKAAHLLVADI